jgi:putative tricarboxylic transport membrane protein
MSLSSSEESSEPIPSSVESYGLRKAGFDLALLLPAFLLGALFDENLRQCLILSLGNPLVFLDSPISLTVILFTVAVLMAPLAKTLKPRMARSPC